jgi:hypothetical protein
MARSGLLVGVGSDVAAEKMCPSGKYLCWSTFWTEAATRLSAEEETKAIPYFPSSYRFFSSSEQPSHGFAFEASPSGSCNLVFLLLDTTLLVLRSELYAVFPGDRVKHAAKVHVQVFFNQVRAGVSVGDAVGFENAVQDLGTRFESEFFREDEGVVAVGDELLPAYRQLGCLFKH